MIEIHWDYTDGTEVSYKEGLKLKDNFTTCCLTFFNNDELADDVIILRKDGKKISRKNIQLSTNKQIRFGHNIEKLLLGGTLNFV